MLAVYGAHSWFWHKAKKQFFWSNLEDFFYNKSKIVTILFIVKYIKWWVLSVVGARNQQVFCTFKWGKKQSVLALVLSLYSRHYRSMNREGGVDRTEPGWSLVEQIKWSETKCGPGSQVLVCEIKWSKRWRKWGRLRASAHCQLLDCQIL